MDSTTIKSKNRFATVTLIYFLIVMVVVLSILFILWITPYGAGISPDSTVYIKVAGNLLSGKGFTVDGLPVTFFPPLYPLLLAVIGLLFNNILPGAHLLSAILYGVNLCLVGCIVYLSAGRKYSTAIIAVVYFFSTGSFFILYSMAWTEPVFITFVMISLLMLLLQVENPNRVYLITSAIALGLACLTRYIGIAFIPAGVLLLFWGGHKMRQVSRITHVGIWLVLSILPLSLFILKNLFVSRTATGRLITFHPLSIQVFFVRVGLRSLNFLEPVVFPYYLRPIMILILAISFLFGLVYVFSHKGNGIHLSSLDTFLPIYGLLTLAFYIILLYLTISFLDASTPVDDRLLSPAFMITIVVIFSGTWSLLSAFHKERYWPWFLFIVILFIGLKIPDAVQTANNIHNQGLVYTSKEWRESETISYLSTLPSNTVVYSNGRDVIEFYTKIESQWIPEIRDATTRVANPEFTNNIKTMCENIVRNNRLLIYFNGITWRGNLPTPAEIFDICPLNTHKIFPDSIIYGK